MNHQYTIYIYISTLEYNLVLKEIIRDTAIFIGDPNVLVQIDPNRNIQLFIGARNISQCPNIQEEPNFLYPNVQNFKTSLEAKNPKAYCVWRHDLKLGAFQ